MKFKRGDHGLQWTVFTLVLNVHLIYGTPPNYSLFQGSAYTGAAAGQRHRNRNWCAYVVHKNVSCTVQGNVESYVEPEVAPCPMHQPDCEQQVMYRTRFRPSYKIAYKTVTELEWRCCPGHQGPDCKDLKASPNRQTVQGPQQYPQPNPGHTRHTQRPERRETGQHEGRHAGADKVRHLEGEVQRLSQTVLDLQAAMAGMTANLRNDLQEDTSKMLVTLLNNMQPPDSARTGGTEESAVHVDGHQATRGGVLGDRGIEEVMARLDDVNDALKSKDEALEELRGTVTGHDGQIRLLMDASQSQPPPPSDLDVLQTYIDGKFEKLKKELDQSMEERMTKLQGSCDDRITSTVQKACDEGCDKRHASLTELMDAKEAALRKEMRELRLDMAVSDGPARTQRQTDIAKREDELQPGDLKDLWREIERVAEAHRVLNMRMDNELAHLASPGLEGEYAPFLEELEARLNVTEQNAEVHCFYIEEKLTIALANESAALRQLIEERFNNMEDQFTTMLVEISNSSFPGMFGESMDAIQAEVNYNKFLLQGLDEKVNAVGELCSTGCTGVTSSGGSTGPSTGTSTGTSTPGGLDSIVKDLKLCRNDLDVLHTEVTGNSDKLRELKDSIDRQSLGHQRSTKSVEDLQKGFISLQDNLGGLAGAVTGLGDSLSKYSYDVQRLNSTCCQAGQSGTTTTPDKASEGTVPSRGAEVSTNKQVEELRDRLNNLSAQVITELTKCKENTQGVSDGVSAVDGRVTRLEKVCGRLDGVSGNVRGLKQGLERHVAGLWDCVRRMNTTLGSHSGDIRSLQGYLQNLQTQLAGVAKHVLKDVTAKEAGTPVRPDTKTPQSRPRITHIPTIHIPLTPHRTSPATARPPTAHHPSAHHPSSPKQPYVPRQSSPAYPRQPYIVIQPNTHRQPAVPRQPSPPALPSSPRQTILTVVPAPPRRVLETGEAGPPGFPRRVTVRQAQGSEEAMPVKGFAGAPGYPPVNPVSFRPEAMPAAAKVPRNAASQPLVVTPASFEHGALADPFSFSAGLTLQTFSGEFGIIRFNMVLVNDGGHYNPHTGIFTVPMAGRYLVTAVLTARQGERVEAVLSVSNRSIQRLWSSEAGSQPEDSSCGCGGTATLSIILSLKKGDRVGLVRTGGQLASLESREMLSTFSAIFLYTPQASR